MKNFKITRKDGIIQYATSDEKIGEYFLNGFGFGIKKFDCESVEEVEYIPCLYKEGYVYYDEDNTKMRAICNVNSTWNGWANPLIHKSSIKKFIKLTSYEEHTYKLASNGYLISTDIVSEDEIYTEVIKPKFVNGEEYYDLSGFGLCFNFKSRK